MFKIAEYSRIELRITESE